MITEVAGTGIHWEKAGNGQSRVVLLHGWGCSTKLMEPLSNALSGDMTVLSVDFPGFGESGRPPEPWGVPEYAGALRALEKKGAVTIHDVASRRVPRALADDARAEDPELNRLRACAEADGVPIVRIETEAFLRTMVKVLRPQRVLEIGTAVGYSSIVMARAGAGPERAGALHGRDAGLGGEHAQTA